MGLSVAYECKGCPQSCKQYIYKNSFDTTKCKLYTAKNVMANWNASASKKNNAK